jgi:hypothetical protein
VSGHAARIGEDRNVYNNVMRKPEENRPLGISRSRWELGIRMDVKEISWGDRENSAGSG